MKKNVKKAFKPAYTVNITDCVTANDVAYKFAMAKQNAGLAISDDDLLTIVNHVVDELVEVVNDALEAVPSVVCICKCGKKLPWYKRLWNWITRK